MFPLEFYVNINQCELFSSLLGDVLAVIGTPDPHEAGYNDPTILLQKADFLSLAPKSWLTSNIVDAFAFIFNRKEEQASGQIKRFWFSTFPYVSVNY